MSAKHYSPQINRVLVCALYHEAKARNKPMTHLVDELLTAALCGTAGMEIAQQIFTADNAVIMVAKQELAAADSGKSGARY